jgi:hypothetical protein
VNANEAPPRPPERAWTVLAGYGRRPARLVVTRQGRTAWMLRTAAALVAWIGGTAATLAFTFDPFVASLPGMLGGAFAFRTWRGRYAVQSFRGECPACGAALLIKPGARIGLPHKLVCYACHHEPHLAAV